MEPHGAIPILEIAARPMGFGVFVSKTLIFKQNIWNVGFIWSFRWHIHLLNLLAQSICLCDIQYKNPIGEFPVYEPNTCLDQWSFLVPLIGGRYHIIPQLAVYTTYILPIGWLYITYHLFREQSKQLLLGSPVFAPPNPAQEQRTYELCTELLYRSHAEVLEIVAGLVVGCFGKIPNPQPLASVVQARGEMYRSTVIANKHVKCIVPISAPTSHIKKNHEFVFSFHFSLVGCSWVYLNHLVNVCF